MNAGLILILWMMAVLLVQAAGGWHLATWVALSLVAALACARARCIRLLARVRALLLAILALFAWFTPGEAIFMDWPRLSPSREGLALALVHGGRLLAVVCWVAILLARMPPDRLVSGLYTLARPCGALGVPAERLALRLLLVLRYVDAARGRGHDWRHWLSTSVAEDDETPVRLARERLGVMDAALLVLVAALLAGWWLLW